MKLTPCVLYQHTTGAKQQVENGDVTGEKPMWAATGGLDFDGRERWEAWSKLQVRKHPNNDRMATAGQKTASQADCAAHIGRA